MEVFEWILLREIPLLWSKVEESLSFILNKMELNIDDGELFDKVCCIKSYITKEKLEEWQKNTRMPCDEKWIEIFKHFGEKQVSFKNILKIVEYCLCLPGSNAPTERTFSIINNFWSSEKAQMKVETLEACICTKFNYDMNCLQFHDFLKNNHKL